MEKKSKDDILLDHAFILFSNLRDIDDSNNLLQKDEELLKSVSYFVENFNFFAQELHYNLYTALCHRQYEKDMMSIEP